MYYWNKVGAEKIQQSSESKGLKYNGISIIKLFCECWNAKIDVSDQSKIQMDSSQIQVLMFRKLCNIHTGIKIIFFVLTDRVNPG